MRQAQQLKSARTQNRLNEMKLQSEMADRSRLNQLRGLMPGVGAEAGLGPKAQKALALDPSQLTNLMKIPKAERDRAKERAKVLSNFGLAILNAPGVQRPSLDAEVRRVAVGYGATPETIPPLGHPSYEAFLTSNIAKAGDVITMLDQAEQAAPPSGYRQVEGGLERIPGGPADPVVVGRLAAAKRGPDGGATPAQQANNREIDEARARLREMEQKLEPGVSLTEEIHRRIGTTDPTTGRRILDFNTFLGRTAWMAMQHKVGQDREQTRWSRVLINPPEFSESAGPKALPSGVSTEEPGLLERGYDYLFGGDDEPRPASDDGPRRGRPRAGGRARARRGGSTKKPISQMSASEITDLLGERGEDLTKDERKKIDARLRALGV
jgi:hypothetical protein